MIKVFCLTRTHVYYTITQSKFWAAFLLIMAANFLNVQPVAKIVFDFYTPVSCGIFALVFSGGFFVVVLSMALLLIFSDIPFKNTQQAFLITRSSKKIWCISYLLYIAVVVLFVIVAVLFETFLILGGKVTFDNSSWGKVIMSIYNTDLGNTYGVTFVGSAPYKSIVSASPIEAVSYVLSTVFIISATMGIVVFMVNLIFKGTAGIIVGGVPVALNLFTNFFQTRSFFMFSPVSWMKLKALIWLPSKWFVLAVLGTVSAVSIIVLLARCRKKADIL